MKPWFMSISWWMCSRWGEQFIHLSNRSMFRRCKIPSAEVKHDKRIHDKNVAWTLLLYCMGELNPMLSSCLSANSSGVYSNPLHDSLLLSVLIPNDSLYNSLISKIHFNSLILISSIELWFLFIIRFQFISLKIDVNLNQTFVERFELLNFFLIQRFVYSTGMVHGLAKIFQPKTQSSTELNEIWMLTFMNCHICVPNKLLIFSVLAE